jgi:hypothetical protein
MPSVVVAAHALPEIKRFNYTQNVSAREVIQSISNELQILKKT